MQRSRQDRVTFLRSKFVDGQLLILPEKYKYSNIIQHHSLPVCSAPACSRPTTEADVHDIPASFLPADDTELVPENTTADEIWNVCRRNAANKSSEGCIRPKKRKVGNTTDDSNPGPKQDNNIADTQTEDCPKYIPNTLITSNLHKGRSLIEDIEENVTRFEDLQDGNREDKHIKKNMSVNISTDIFKMLKNIAQERSFIQKLEEVYKDRGVGPIPDHENPDGLCRELKRVGSCQQTDVSWTSIQAVPGRLRDNRPTVETHSKEQWTLCV